MRESSGSPIEPQEGLVIIFDEPRRAPILNDIADERGVFRDAFSAVDWPFDMSMPELCVLSFDGQNLTHVALGEGGKRAVTAKRGVTFSRILACEPLPLSELASQLGFPIERVAVRASSPQGHLVEGETWSAFFRQVRRLAPDMAAKLIELERFRRARGHQRHTAAYEMLTLEADAIGTALEFAGMPRDVVLRTARLPDRDDGTIAPFISTLDPRHQKSPPPQQQPLIDDEVSALAHDAAVSAAWLAEAIAEGSLRGSAYFANRSRALTVYNVNNHPLETTLGVDLIYQNVPAQSFVLIQYKMFRQTGVDAPMAVRVDDRLEHQLDRMDAWIAELPVEPTPRGAQRLTAEPFFWKLCLPTLREVGSPDLVRGWYLSRPWMRELISGGDAVGPRGGRRVTEEMAKGGMSNSLFADLVQGTFVGSTGDGSDVFARIVKVLSSGGRSVIVCREE
jgi:hypothetical protein